jgi:hypothetical protein
VVPYVSWLQYAKDIIRALWKMPHAPPPDTCQHCHVRPVRIICLHETGEGKYCSNECCNAACPNFGQLQADL